MWVERTERHIIKESHPYYSMLDEFCFFSKNLYNYANYQIRQCFIICSKPEKEEVITQEQQEFLMKLNAKAEEYNQKRIEKYKEDIRKGKKVKEPKRLAAFGAGHKCIDYNFSDFLCKGADYAAMPSVGAASSV